MIFFFFCINVSTAISTTIFKIIHVGISFKGMVFISLFNNIKYQWSWPLTISSNHFIPEFKSVLKLNVSNQKSWYHAVSLVFVFLFFLTFFFFKKKQISHWWEWDECTRPLATSVTRVEANKITTWNKFIHFLKCLCNSGELVGWIPAFTSQGMGHTLAMLQGNKCKRNKIKHLFIYRNTKGILVLVFCTMSIRQACPSSQVTSLQWLLWTFANE